MQTYPPKLKKLLDDCNIPVAVLLSLTIQVLLILLGNCRKNNSKPWIRFLLWSTYLGADTVSAYALGAISNKLLDLYDDEKNAGCEMDAKTELAAFWAPFLLIHMGGPDTITAYALEDNELWLRQLLALAGQTLGAGNVFLMAFKSSSSLSFLSIPLLLAGVVKCGERICALRSASTDQLKDSLFIYEDRVNPSLEDSGFKNESERKSNAGYAVAEERYTDGSSPQVDFSVIIDNSNIPEQSKLLIADELLYITKRVFLDSTLTTKSKDIVQTVYKNLSFKDAFQVIDVELGFMFELFYTKLPLLCTLWGFAFRLITFFITCFTFILFFFTTFLVHRKKNYELLDISITFVLIVVAIILDLYSALLILSSDRFLAWLSKHNSNDKKITSILQAIKRKPRWSNNISQLSIVSLLWNPKPLPCSYILQNSWIDYKQWEKLWYLSQKQVPEGLRKLIFRYFKTRAAQTSTDKSQQSLKEMNDFFIDEFEMDRQLDFAEDLGKSILFWHIVTEVSYYCCQEKIKKHKKHFAHCELINDLSRYILYLLVLQPSVLSVDGIDPMTLQKTIEKYRPRLRTSSEIKACEELIGRPMEGTSSSLDELSKEAFALGAKIKDNYHETNSMEKWNLLGSIWLKLMEYAARNSKGSEHAKLLIDGGEFFSHVWLLMTHFGLTDHFQISETSEAVGFVAI